ncbi:MAG: sarcosine oxidase subunit gamma family protein [Tateyamaria sp.]|uniref:sarcosine oxidase subunit gamma n=1 Tax=Tateyamaria sp. TaxID=1929288 RepID=UPI00326FE219
MSKTVTALNGASWEGGIAHISEAPLQGMITLRGDLNSAAMIKAATGATGQKMPAQGAAQCAGDKGICWMSPDEVLVLCSYAEVGKTLDKMRVHLGDAHSLAVDVSDARALFVVKGANAREVIAKLAPVDLKPAAFTPGMFRRTRMAQVPAAFWMRDEDAFHIVCFRSNAQYMFDLLKTAAQPGSEVGYFATS